MQGRRDLGLRLEAGRCWSPARLICAWLSQARSVLPHMQHLWQAPCGFVLLILGTCSLPGGVLILTDSCLACCRFDMFSVGILLLQMAFPSLRSDNNLVRLWRCLTFFCPVRPAAPGLQVILVQALASLLPSQPAHQALSLLITMASVLRCFLVPDPTPLPELSLNPSCSPVHTLLTHHACRSRSGGAWSSATLT